MQQPEGWFSNAMFGNGPIGDIQSRFAKLEVPDLFSDWLSSLRVIDELVQRKTGLINRGIYGLVASVLVFLIHMGLS